jgi:hypothetical protein
MKKNENLAFFGLQTTFKSGKWAKDISFEDAQVTAWTDYLSFATSRLALLGRYLSAGRQLEELVPVRRQE